jgi:hypothetical protein
MAISHLLPVAIFVVAIALITRVDGASAPENRHSHKKQCRFLPGDKEWPSQKDWDKLNSTVSGRLIATISPGHVCHDPTYDAQACAALQTSWTLPQAQ